MLKKDLLLLSMLKTIELHNIFVKTDPPSEFFDEQNVLKNSYLFEINMWPWSTKAVLSRWGIFITIAKNTLYGSKL